MPAEELGQHAILADDVEAWVAHHPYATIGISAFLLWISVSPILRMWLMHRQECLRKKILWSVMLLIPVFGWMLYGGFFQVPDYTDVPAPPPADPP